MSLVRAAARRLLPQLRTCSAAPQVAYPQLSASPLVLPGSSAALHPLLAQPAAAAARGFASQGRQQPVDPELLPVVRAALGPV